MVIREDGVRAAIVGDYLGDSRDVQYYLLRGLPSRSVVQVLYTYHALQKGQRGGSLTRLLLLACNSNLPNLEGCSLRDQGQTAPP